MAKSSGLRLRVDVSGFWLRTCAGARIASEELRRGIAAGRRYDQLLAGRAAEAPAGDRGSKARQVFNEIYARPDARMMTGHSESPFEPPQSGIELLLPHENFR